MFPSISTGAAKTFNILSLVGLDSTNKPNPSFIAKPSTPKVDVTTLLSCVPNILFIIVRNSGFATASSRRVLTIGIFSSTLPSFKYLLFRIKLKLPSVFLAISKVSAVRLVAIFLASSSDTLGLTLRIIEYLFSIRGFIIPRFLVSSLSDRKNILGSTKSESSSRSIVTLGAVSESYL